MKSKYNHPSSYLSAVLASGIKELFAIDAEATVESTDRRFGDFQSNAALQLQKELQRAPRDIAKELAEYLSNIKEVAEAEVAGPGFINITLSDDYWLQFMSNLSDDFGYHESPEQSEKVQVEFISANPTGPLTLGNARGGFIGDVLSNVLDTQGYDVTREYYFNDAGTQVSKLLESVKVEAGLLEVEDRQYSGEYISKLAQDFKEKLTTEDDATLKKLLTKTIFTEYIQPDIKKMNIEFDEWFNETSLIEDGSFDATMDILREKGLLFERDGAQWLNTERGGDPRRERVFIKSNGDPSYFAPDVAYHVNIFSQRRFDRAIKELGPDHVAQFPSVRAVISLLYPDKKLEMVTHQQLRLIKNGQEFKMSKRSGQYVTVGELIDRVGADVARWFMLMRSSDTHMDFDLDLAEEQSQKNPFWYVMYAYVRLNAILRQAREREINSASEMTTIAPIEKEMIKQIALLPDLLDTVSRTYEVHKLTFYGQEFARLFHEWYEEIHVLDLPQNDAAQKLYMLEKIKKMFENYFEIIGIEPLESM